MYLCVFLCALKKICSIFVDLSDYPVGAQLGASHHQPFCISVRPKKIYSLCARKQASPDHPAGVPIQISACTACQSSVIVSKLDPHEFHLALEFLHPLIRDVDSDTSLHIVSGQVRELQRAVHIYYMIGILQLLTQQPRLQLTL